MKLLCKLFGHQPPAYGPKGWWSPGEEYASVKIGPTDGIGRVHASVVGECARCQAPFTMARVHLPNDQELRAR